MATLALDTATGTCAVALAHDGQVTELSLGGRRHARAALAAIGTVCERAGVGPDALTRIVVGVGPGSFTGIRVGIATALGIGRGAGVPVVGRSSLAAVRFGAGGGDVTAVIDARRGEVFVRTPDGAEALADPARLDPPFVGATAVGDGALAHRATLAALGWRIPDGPIHTLRAAALLALDAADPAGAVAPEPAYLRAPDATPPPSVARSAAALAAAPATR